MRAHQADNITLIAPTVAQSLHWLKNRFGPRVTPQSVPLIWCAMARAPRPDQYPETAAELQVLLTQESPLAAEALHELAGTYPREAYVVLATDRAPKPAALGAINLVTCGSRAQVRRAARARGHEGTPATSWLSAVKLRRLRVLRAESPWIYGRYSNADLVRLVDKAITVIGVGSIGAQVAKLLAQSGIGTVRLIDPDNFELANASRHLLGVPALGFNKALAVASHLRRSFPNCTLIEGFGQSWQTVYGGQPEVLSGADLILSLTGSWSADAALSDLQQLTRHFPRIVFGWVEPMACASHALLLTHGGACLRCHIGGTGDPDQRVTQWPDGVESRYTCGALHTPFGAPNLGFSQALLANIVIDALLGKTQAGEWRVWTDSPAKIAAHGGRVTPQWSDTFGPLPLEPTIHRLSWQQSALCAIHRAEAE